MKPRSLAFLLALAIGTSADAQVYVNDFSSNTNGWSSANGVARISTPFNCGGAFCGTVLGSGLNGGQPFSTEMVALDLAGLAPHSTASVMFDLFIISSWDGNYGGAPFGPDYIEVKGNGNTLMHTTFNNVGNAGQCYPVLICNADVNNAPKSGAAEVNTLGSGWDFYGGNAVYQIGLSWNDASSNMNLTFEGLNLQPWGDEGWAIDNVRVFTNAEQTVATPEPATLALLATGLLGLGGFRWRRRRTAGA